MQSSLKRGGLAPGGASRRPFLAGARQAQPRRAVVSRASERFDAQVAVVLGTQWGDEGKGKLVDILAQQYDIVARAQVGASRWGLIFRSRDPPWKHWEHREGGGWEQFPPLAGPACMRGRSLVAAGGLRLTWDGYDQARYQPT
jgi:hypothetical protein